MLEKSWVKVALLLLLTSCSHEPGNSPGQPTQAPPKSSSPAIVVAKPAQESSPTKEKNSSEAATQPAPKASTQNEKAPTESDQGNQPKKGTLKAETPPKTPKGNSEPTQLPQPSSNDSPKLAAAPAQNLQKKTTLVHPKNPKCALKEIPQYSRTETYGDFPFKSGEVAKYELDYGAIHVGYGYMRVGKPLRYSIISHYDDVGKPVKKSYWHMVFSGHAFTGDWYSGIYSGNDKVQAYSRPWDFGISKFYLEERASTLLSSIHKKKFLDFHQGDCKVKTKEVNVLETKTKHGNYDLTYGAVDALGGFYKLRTFDYSKGPVKFIVYSSEKNWLLEAIPKKVETVSVPAGTFLADMLVMRTYLGEKLEQRGALTVWVARNHPNRPLVKVEGEFKFGDITLELEKFTPGS